MEAAISRLTLHERALWACPPPNLWPSPDDARLTAARALAEAYADALADTLRAVVAGWCAEVLGWDALPPVLASRLMSALSDAEYEGEGRASEILAELRMLPPERWEARASDLLG